MAQKSYVTVASAETALELAGDAKMEYAVNGGKMTGSIMAKKVGAVALAGLAIVSGKSLVKDVSSIAKLADVQFSTRSEETADAVSGKNYQYGGVGGCFTAGTKVKTQDGGKNIEDVKAGDYVLAENPDTREQEYKKVVRTFIHEKYELVHVTVGEEEIETTVEHPFYVEDAGFVPASELKAGDIIRTSDGENLPILKVEIELLEEPVLVYNFEVEDFHTYYVSEIGVLVHNTCPVTGDVKGGRGYVKPDFYVTEDGTVIPTNIVKQNSQYDRIEIEIKSGKAVRPQNALDDWNDFLGPNQTDIDPFTGEKSIDRIWSLDGQRSIRFGEHEMESMDTARFHYHKETWYNGYVINELQRIQKR